MMRNEMKSRQYRLATSGKPATECKKRAAGPPPAGPAPARTAYANYSRLARGLLGKTERPLSALRNLRKQGVGGMLGEFVGIVH